MDITSPFFVVPVMAIIFLSCILYASLTGGAEFHETVPDESSPRPDTH
jgi:hypothetical protein